MTLSLLGDTTFISRFCLCHWIIKQLLPAHAHTNPTYEPHPQTVATKVPRVPMPPVKVLVTFARGAIEWEMIDIIKDVKSSKSINGC